jgi:hypothetical protein
MLEFAKWLILQEKKKPENYIDGMSRELNIDPNSIPDFIETGPIEIPEEGLLYNQAIWRVIKPIREDDKFVKIQFHKSLSPNLDQVVLKRLPDGQLTKYPGPLNNKIHIITIDKFAEIFARPWQTVIQGAAMGGGGVV